MADYTNEQLLEMYHKLPKDVQEAILSVNTSEAIREIGEKRKLMIDKIGELADETGLVMLGLTHPGQYISHLIERLGISQEAAQEIAEEVNNRILFPIRDSLRKIQEEKEAIEEKPVPEMPSMPETATLVPSPMILPETPITAAMPPPALPAGLPAAEAGKEPAIFQAKTKEEIFRLPLQTVEKTPESKKFDPYKEPLS